MCLADERQAQGKVDHDIGDQGRQRRWRVAVKDGYVEASQAGKNQRHRPTPEIEQSDVMEHRLAIYALARRKSPATIVGRAGPGRDFAGMDFQQI